ncbi:hypothetical protein MIND_00133300 [Mycena indigotica]|uniref:Uncharacterized protein n=1 Tax=Mycena indigotica TaxID=2126181 RepID=A0A8H6TGB0_9AGAR|nr:uncharacterized protein MIND_00133300 [Mycena indigotica]KAF7316151.1 hypothetical protein MIND_00133300 [Mycena indigotica]
MAESSSSPSSRNTSPCSEPEGFSLSASPPLILAFLAVGIFGFAMASFFLWKRWTERRNVPTTTNLEDIRPVEPPKIWDLWCSFDTQTKEWASIQPLAATIWDRTPSPSSASSARVREEQASVSTGMVETLRHRFRRPQQSTTLASEEPPKILTESSSNFRLQIAVAIVMPELDSLSTKADKLSGVEYAIGLFETPWHK